jgi:Rrf2 family protein
MNKSCQIGLLFTLYLARNGKSRAQDAAKELKVSKLFLEQIARKLRIAGVIKTVRGPGGGYALVADARAYHVVQALGSVQYISNEELNSYQEGCVEERALGSLLVRATVTMRYLLAQRITDLVHPKLHNENSEDTISLAA